MEDSAENSFSSMKLKERTCAYGACICHESGGAVDKTCSACGIVSYCSKEAQVTDWTSHKILCKGLRQFRHVAKDLSIEQKQSINRIDLALPTIDIEYERRYPHSPLQHRLYIHSALQATKRMVESNVTMLHKDEEDSLEDHMKRWQEYSPQLDEFICNAKVGDVYKEKKNLPYKPSAPQHFRNSPIFDPLILMNGRTIIDVGFVDFGITFDSIDSIAYDQDPVKVMAFDSDPFCVAKSLVMHTMMNDKHEPNARTIVEVWLSSLWSKNTLAAFKRATSTILQDDARNLDNKVKDIIKFWNRQKAMKKRAAISFQFDALLQDLDSKFAMHCCSFSEEADRSKYLRYYLTKAFYEDDATTIGSVVMNSVKEDIGCTQAFESCFEAAPSRIHTVFNKTKGITVYDRTVNFFEDNMKAYIKHVRNGTLIFTPKLGMISESNLELISAMKESDPCIISWSNIIDYIPPTEFHRIAKQVSGKDTVHYLHSCNWTNRVYGTDIFDLNTDSRLFFFSAGMCCIERALTFISGFTPQGTHHFRDVCSTILGRKYVNRFFEYFFEGEDVNCCCSNGKTPLLPSFPLARNVTTAFIAFSYSNDMEFGKDSYDYKKALD